MWIFLLGYILQNYIFIIHVYEGDFILLLHQSFEIKKKFKTTYKNLDSFKFFELQNSNVTLYLKEYKYITLLGLTPSKTYDNEENL